MKIRIQIEKSQSLLEALRSQGYYLPAYCGGQGRCGKCRVRILNMSWQNNQAGPGDIACIGSEEFSAGWRLACLVYGEGICELEIPDYMEEGVRAAGFPDETGKMSSDKAGLTSLTLAVDIGSTTIAASLVDTDSRRVLRTVTGMNHQRAYGADVLSRIDAANRGEGERLQVLLMRDLDRLCERLGIGERILALSFPVIISGNTTMEHLLQGLSCRTLGAYPFKPVDLSLHRYKNLTILPGISTFVGADIVSGIVACGIDQKEEVSILVDLGTNGEMIIGNKDRILAASTAAGPAFEGGNISCGMAGVPGAIDRVVIEDRRALVTTIGGKKPIGLCGTGVLETVYELFKEKIIDETGLMEDEFFEEGFPLAEDVIFSAKDVREVQLAKAAIRAGIEILLVSYGVVYDQIDSLYLAGGFGQKLNGKKAVGIGMLPEELEDRIVPVGNSSLEGAVLFAGDSKTRDRFEHVIAISEEITLSNHTLFDELYVGYMGFDGDREGSCLSSVSCPSIENRISLPRLNQNTLDSLTDLTTVRRLVEENAQSMGVERYILPVWQNLEAVVYGGAIKPFSVSYVIENLEELEEFEFDLLEHPLIKTVLKTIPFYRGYPLFLEVEAPFSILSALMDPVKLYMCFEEQPQLLLPILCRIADASVEYIRACVQAGCRFISMADPTGTADLVGEDYFKRFSGASVVYLMEKCDAFLDGAVMHLCQKLSKSLVMTGLARAEYIDIPDGMDDYIQILSMMSRDPDIHFTGMTCLHDERPDLKKSCRILYNNPAADTI